MRQITELLHFYYQQQICSIIWYLLEDFVRNVLLGFTHKQKTNTHTHPITFCKQFYRAQVTLKYVHLINTQYQKLHTIHTIEVRESKISVKLTDNILQVSALTGSGIPGQLKFCNTLKLIYGDCRRF